MGERTSANSGASGRAPTAERPDDIRNVILVGPSGSGKTTLVEALGLATGAITRAGRVEDGTTVSDYDDIEHRQQRSVQLSLIPVAWAGLKINLLDAPGYADFVGELRAGLRAADAALFVVSAADGVENIGGTTRMLWEECAAVAMPRAIVVTHLEAARANFDEMTEACRTVFGGEHPDRVLPLYRPILGHEAADGHRSVTGLEELLTSRTIDYASGVRMAVDTDPQSETVAARNRLIEGIIAESEDESLLDRYLDGAELDGKRLTAALELAVSRGNFHPVLAAAPAANGARQGLGTVELLDLIAGGFPTPAEHRAPEVTTIADALGPPLTCDPDGPLAAEVIKTTSDPYVGRVSLVRVFSGSLRPDETVHVCGHGLGDRGHEDHDVDERIGTIGSLFGKQQRSQHLAIAGDIVCVAKLTRAETGDTLSAKDFPLLIRAWSMPDPLLPIAVQAHSKSDEDKLSSSLTRLVAEDPTMRLEQNPYTHQVVLWCLGEAHRDVAIERLRTRYGVQVDVVAHTVPLRATFATKAAGRGRHVKQSGGHGQYAICEIDVEPLPGGSGIEFVDRVVGGSVPRQFIPSVEKGVRAQAARGVIADCPLVDVRITLHDGKAHSVDSSDAAFQTAGALALREAAAAARIDLLEPVDEVTVVVGDDDLGPAMSDLSGRRGRVLGTEQSGLGRTAIRAEVPELEIDRYAIDLRSLSHGSGRFTRRYLRHEPMPMPVAQRLRENARTD